MNTNYARIARNDDEPYDAEEEWIGERAAELADTDEIRAEADEWNEGMQSSEHYSELERLMADLHEIEPAKLLGSGVLVDLYRLAKVHGIARERKALELAADKAKQEWANRQAGPEGGE